MKMKQTHVVFTYIHPFHWSPGTFDNMPPLPSILRQTSLSPKSYSPKFSSRPWKATYSLAYTSQIHRLWFLRPPVLPLVVPCYHSQVLLFPVNVLSPFIKNIHQVPKLVFATDYFFRGGVVNLTLRSQPGGLEILFCRDGHTRSRGIPDLGRQRLVLTLQFLRYFWQLRILYSDAGWWSGTAFCSKWLWLGSRANQR